MLPYRRHLRRIRQDTRWHNAHRDLFNRVWSTPGLSSQQFPGASAAEAAAFQAGQAAALAVDLSRDMSGGADPRSRATHLPRFEAARITALLIEFTRAYPRTLAYPGQVFEVAWPVLAEAHRQGLIRGVCDVDQLRLVVARAAAVVSALLRGPTASWWNIDSGEWLWTSSTRSLTTGRVLSAPPRPQAVGAHAVLGGAEH